MMNMITANDKCADMKAAAQHVGFRSGLLECGMNTFAVTGRVRHATLS